MSQERLRRVLAAAVEAARAHPDWHPDDGLCVILADDDTMMHACGFVTGPNLAECLEYHAGKVRQAARPD